MRFVANAAEASIHGHKRRSKGTCAHCRQPVGRVGRAWFHLDTTSVFCATDSAVEGVG